MKGKLFPLNTGYVIISKVAATCNVVGVISDDLAPEQYDFNHEDGNADAADAAADDADADDDDDDDDEY